MGSVLEKFAQFLSHNKGLSTNSVSSYLSDLKPILKLYPDPNNLTLDKALRYFKKLGDAGLSSRSISRKMSALKLFFEFCIETKICAQNPVSDMKPMPFNRKLPQVLSTDEADSLLKSPTKPVDALILRMLYATGMRVSELVGLKLSDVDLQAGVFRVLGKGNKTRLVPIDPDTILAIQNYIKNIRKNRKTKSNALLISQQGTPFTRQAVWKMMKKYALKEGLGTDLSPHAMRHAFATHLLEGGINLRSLQMLLGHSDVTTTEIYSHVSSKQLQKTLQNFHPRSSKKKT